ncbi:MAG: DNA translocase FtsK [Candidatus Caccovivens sp.]
MAIYKLNSKKKKENNKNVKKIVGFSFIAVASVVFLFLTGVVPVLQTFLLGLFGVFGYPLCIILFVVGLALLNNRKYVMSKKYTICLILSVFFALCMLQLAVVGNNKVLLEDGQTQIMPFWDYLAKNYLDKWTAGGFLIGIFSTIFLYIANIYGAYIIFALSLVICVALLVDYLNFMKKNKEIDSPVSIKISETERKEQKQILSTPSVREKEDINVVLDGNLKEQQAEVVQENKPLSARQILGLDKKRNKAYEYGEGNPPSSYNQSIKKVQETKPKSLKELILTPPQIDIDEYFKDMKKDAPTKEEVSANLTNLKSDTNSQKVEQEFKPESEQVDFKRSLPEVKSDELVEQADDILKSAIEEEKNENPDIFEEVENDPERNLLNSLPERNNGGNFERNSFERTSFDRGDRTNFERRGFERDRLLNQEDRDARDAFRAQAETIAMRNGSLLRGNEPLQAEEEEKKEPYFYEKPPIDFITTKSVDLSELNEDVATKRVLLENTLETFGVPAKVQGVVVGPAVTRYELEMPQGISVSKIKNRVDDIALSLAAEGAIRIEAPVPGKSVVGIEVPNSSIATISLKDVIMSKEFQQASSPLTFAIGKDISGKIICGDMKKLTHLLVAGASGSGKSVCLNSIILSLIYKASPEDARIILIDPKRVEFASYEALPHLIMPNIVCDTQKAINTLAWAVNEMERRFELLGFARVKNIDEYNQTPDVLSGKVEKMPFIVLIVDELSDLMMTGKREVEEKIIRLAQKSRAAGIHLILATQKPIADVVTGLIKGNIPSRISFAVTSAIDSMVILDRVGAEKLLGKGDMLYYPIGAQEPKRVQGCFITTNEINNIVDYVRDNNKPIFDKEIEDAINNPNKTAGQNGGGYNNDIDPLLPQALKASIECKQASATMIRRRFAIGYPRAARIIDQMEAAGYISSADGVKGRTVYTTEEEFRELFGDQYD